MLRRDVLASVVMVAVCCVPWLVTDFVRVIDAPEFVSSLSLRDRLQLGLIVELENRAQGAVLAVGLLCAEAFTLARLSSARASRHVVALSLLLVTPFQLEWLHVFDSDLVNEWFCVPIVAAFIIPLSLRKGGGRTAQVVAVLALASFAAMAVEQAVLAESFAGFNPCTPASRGVVAISWFTGHFPFRWLELAPWSALLSLAIALLVMKPIRAVLAVLVFGVAMYVVDGIAIVRMRAAATHAPTVLVPEACPDVIVTESDGEAAFSAARARGFSCAYVYGRDDIDRDATSFNPFDHVRALAALESIFRPL